MHCVESAGHAASVDTAAHVPRLPATLQRLQTPQEELPQHTPSTQLPEPQSVPPEQVEPFGRGTQLPLLQIFPVPQLVPLATLPVDVQTIGPVVHDVVPVWQTFPPGWHAWLGVHAVHAPLKQSKFVPQAVPFARFVPESVQTGTPVPHANVPAWQTLFGVQAEPFAHTPHMPALQTLPVPQLVPLATLPVVVQTDAPVMHEVVPARHRFPLGVHGWLGVHMPQLPLKQ